MFGGDERGSDCEVDEGFDSCGFHLSSMALTRGTAPTELKTKVNMIAYLHKQATLFVKDSVVLGLM